MASANQLGHTLCCFEMVRGLVGFDDRYQSSSSLFYFFFSCLLAASFYVCSGCISEHMGCRWGHCAHVEARGQCWVFSSVALILFFKVDRSLNLELTSSPTLAGYLAPRIYLSLPRPHAGVGGIHHIQLLCGCWGLSSGPCARVASTLSLWSGCAMPSAIPYLGKIMAFQPVPCSERLQFTSPFGCEF